jgi:3'-5' exoribonuclease
VALKVSQMAVNTWVDEAFAAVIDARTHTKKDGGAFLRGRLRDHTGIIDVVAWDNVEEFRNALVVGKVVKVRGQVAKAFNGEGPELTIKQIRLARDGEFNPADLVPTSARSRAALLDDLQQILASLRPPIRDVVRAAIEVDLDRFASFPAASELHHAWLGGLLEHTLEVAHAAHAISQIIPGVDRDLAVAGALLHDIGKLDAYDVGTTFKASDSGRLLGHILTGYLRVQLACEKVSAPPDLALRLLHVVASHHGEKEYGAAQEPATGEAIVVHYADELSAQLMQVRGAIADRADPNARWTDRAKGIKRDVFVGDLSQF